MTQRRQRTVQEPAVVKPASMPERRIPCEYCGTPLVDPIEEPFNIAFIAHLRANDDCMELFSYGMANLRNELGVRLGKRPSVDGL